MAQAGRPAGFLIAGLLVLGLFVSLTPEWARPALAAGNPIVAENQQQGSLGWQLSQTADDVSKQIKGYASSASVLQGGSLNLYVSVNPAQTYTIDFYRIGWYGGLGGRLELHSGPLTGIPQPACPPDPTTGLIACNWTPSYAITIPVSWTSGVYLAVLTNAAGYQNYVNFVVRDGRPAPFLYQHPVNTAQAYNNYPDDGTTGKSLYEFNSFGANTIAGTPRAVKVSFDRPYYDDGSGDFLSYEVQFVRWVEKSGYDVTYATDLDTHTNGSQLLTHQAFLSVGHNEYYSNEMYNAVQAARDAGVNLAFFGSNAIYWQVRFEPSAGGVANRIMVCYKDANIDPVQGPTTTVNFRDPPVNRPEQALIGIMFTNMTQGSVTVPYIVTNSSNWVYANTGFKDGDSVPNLVGYEVDRNFSEYPAPIANRVLLSQSPFVDFDRIANQGNSSIYQAPSGAWVFATGTSSWTWDLDSIFTSNQPDPRIQQATANVLNAFLVGAPVVSRLSVTAPATATAGQALPVVVTATNARGNPVTTYTGTVHFNSSDAQAVLPADYTFTSADAGQHTFSVTLKTPGGQTLTATDTVTSSITGSSSVTVSPAATTSKLVLSGLSNATAGTAQTATVTIYDPNNSVVTGYAGTVHFSSTDPQAALPANYTFTSADAGTHSFPVTLKTAGSITVTAADTVTSSETGSQTVTVSPGTLDHLALTPGSASITAGGSQSYTATSLDQYNNSLGDVTANTTFSIAPNGSCTGASCTATVAGAHTVTGSNGGKTGTASLNVTPAPASKLSLTAPTTAVTSGSSFPLKVTLTDKYGNVATGYTGTVHFTGSDPAWMVGVVAMAPADYTFTAADAGVHTFTVTLVTPPSQTITVTDTANTALTATSTISVT